MSEEERNEMGEETVDGRVFDEGECLCPMYEDHDGKCGDDECNCHA